MDKPEETIAVSQGDLLHQVFDQSTEGFQVIDRNWRYVFVNETVARHGRSTVGELIGHTMMEKYPGIEDTPVFKQLKRAMDEGISVSMENEFIFPGGEKGWFQLFIHPWTEGVMIFSVDITAHKKAESELIEIIGGVKEEHLPKDCIEKIGKIREILKKLSEPSVNVVR